MVIFKFFEGGLMPNSPFRLDNARYTVFRIICFLLMFCVRKSRTRMIDIRIRNNMIPRLLP